jgi:hypothetical protein
MEQQEEEKIELQCLQDQPGTYKFIFQNLFFQTPNFVNDLKIKHWD